MEESNQKFEGFTDRIKDYINLRIELIKLKVIEKGAIVISTSVAYIIIFILSIFLVLFGLIALGLLIGELVGSYAAGFGILTLLILILIFIVFFFKDKAIIKPIENKFIHSFFNK